MSNLEWHADIVTITETWFHAAITDQEFTPPGYTSFRKDRDTRYYTEGTYSRDSRGGVCIMVKNELKPVPLNVGKVDAEILWIQIFPTPTNPISIGVCYRPEVDQKPTIQKICSSISEVVCNQDGSCILTGDFNFRNIDWDLLTGTNDVENTFIESITDNMLTQLVTSPTRINNILDLVFTNNTDMISDITVDEPFSTSDHNMITMEVNCQVSRTTETQRRVYLYTDGDYDGLNQELISR